MTLSRMVTVLRWLIYILAAAQIFKAILFLAGQDKVYLPLNGEIWSKTFASFGTPDQIILIVAHSIHTGIFLWGLYQLSILVRWFAKGVIFSIDTINCVKRFSVALIFYALAESLLPPILIAYLWARDILPAAPEMDLSFLMNFLDVHIFTAGVLFFIISRILETGLQNQNELELTI